MSKSSKARAESPKTWRVLAAKLENARAAGLLSWDDVMLLHANCAALGETRSSLEKTTAAQKSWSANRKGKRTPAKEAEYAELYKKYLEVMRLDPGLSLDSAAEKLFVSRRKLSRVISSYQPK